ncbi:hypothetical protein H2198_005187 [Neophaeococcomyces mojaviensis]|uniref:Uncharacterized protein n=1 Tax=Neophaeococcomyces mojaviensis TaxID=3383035 RepID=A0ACC3A6G9_9EURO|nr:hypothetical protein H2198_005187 [Knufia sp. JES_112]
MSSLRNAVARRPHKERSQPQSRQKWGLLEKHKDYSLRAKDYNTKKQKLEILSQKSREKHPDEFAFGMLSSAQGKLGRRGDENRLSHDAVQLLKTQDAGYLRTAAQRNRREIEKVEEEVGLDGIMKERKERSDGRKVVFDQDGEPVKKKRKTESLRQSLDESEADDLNSSFAKPSQKLATRDKHEDAPTAAPAQHKSKKQLEREKDKLAQLKLARKKRQRLEEMRKAKLDLLKKRQKEILAAAGALELQRAKMARVVGGTNKNGVKFKLRERKR